MAPSISVIVAIYQSEPFLVRCLESIRNQTFSDFEVLLVDDGSTDGSGSICDEYASLDSRFRVFHKSHEGRSLTRKCGVDNAVGEYTIHCDSDDWMESNMLEILFNEAKSNNVDILLSAVWMEGKGGSLYRAQRPTVLDADTIISEMYETVSPSLWNKLIKRDCYRDAYVRFNNDVEYGEDLYILIQLLRHPFKISYIPNALYHYDRYSNKNSITKNSDVSDIECTVCAIENQLGIRNVSPVNRLKCDALWMIFQKDKNIFSKKKTMYTGVKSYMLKMGVLHPIRHWNYWILLFYI